MFGLVMVIKNFHSYVYGQDFKVLTDHASLKSLMGQKDLSGHLARWSLKLEGLRFTIEHSSGRHNVIPDALSSVYKGVYCIESSIVGNTKLLMYVNLSTSNE